MGVLAGEPSIAGLNAHIPEFYGRTGCSVLAKSEYPVATTPSGLLNLVLDFVHQPLHGKSSKILNTVGKQDFLRTTGGQPGSRNR